MGFHPNREKTQIYKWAPQHHKETIALSTDTLQVQAPVFQYLGHVVAHPEWQSRAHDDILTLVSADLLRYKVLPLNAFECAMLINTTLLPKWVYRGMFVFNDRLLAAIDSKSRDLVTVAKNIERTHNATHVHAPVSMDGVGVKQAF